MRVDLAGASLPGDLVETFDRQIVEDVRIICRDHG